MDGGYDEGYRACSCFWGDSPGRLLKLLASHVHSFSGHMALDVGCGEGKNARFLAERGARVHAVDVSTLAIRNAMNSQLPNKGINWIVADACSLAYPPNYYDIVVAYGLLHCLKNVAQIRATVRKLQSATREGGWHIICAFNEGHHDMIAHPGFIPTLASHDFYLNLYSGWDVTYSTNEQLHETHPNNNLQHFHTLTRILAKKVSGNDLPA